MAASAEPLRPPEASKPRVALWPRRAVDIARLMRLDRPIGIFLLLWPVLWALWIAGGGHPDVRVTAVFIAGVIVMRSAGCVINDFADRDIDPLVERTRDRPLAARRLYPNEAFTVFGLLVACALLLVLQLDETTLHMSLVGAALTVTYPFMKRFFPLPQLYLGAAFGWGVPMAFAALDGEVPRVGWLLFVVTLLWAGVYDSMYAMVDREDDRRAGVRSSAILFGDLDRVIVGAMQLMVLLGLYLAGQSAGLGLWFHVGLGCGALLFVYQQWLIRHREPRDCFRAFLNNNYFGLVVFAGVVADYLL